MSQTPKRQPSPDGDSSGSLDPRPTKKRPQVHRRLVNDSGPVHNMIPSTSVRVKTDSGRVSFRKTRGSLRESQQVVTPAIAGGDSPLRGQVTSWHHFLCVADSLTEVTLDMLATIDRDLNQGEYRHMIPSSGRGLCVVGYLLGVPPDQEDKVPKKRVQKNTTAVSTSIRGSVMLF